MGMRYQKSRKFDRKDYRRGERSNKKNYARVNIMRGGYRL